MRSDCERLLNSIHLMEQVASNDRNPVTAMDRILEECVSATSCASGRLYLLQLGNSAYEIAWEVRSQGYQDRFDLRTLLRQDREQSLIEDAILSQRTINVGDNAKQIADPIQSPSRLIVPIVRQQACLGVIDLDSADRDHFSGIHELAVESAAALISLLVEKDRSLRLFKELHTPISYFQEENAFYTAIMEVIAKASGMPYIALRELEDNQLVCIASHGFDHVKKEKLDLSPVADYPTFEKVIKEGKAQAERTMDAARLESLRSKPQLRHVRSFVAVPVKVGTSIFGTLSIGAECPYDYSDLETNGYETIANSVGVAIANYRNFHAIGEQSFQHGKISADLTAVEVAQAARHEARGYLAEMRETLVVADRLAKRGQRRDVEELREQIASLDELVRDIEISIDRIKDVSAPPKTDLTTVELAELWDEAFKMVIGRLSTLRISPHIEGKAMATVYPDHLRHVFLNLILNSIDAFARKAKKGNRRITVTIDPQSDDAEDILVRYVDNATGIDPSQLPPRPDGSMRNVEEIFERNISSKPDGSGYGLFLARSILAKHKGSIDLVSYRNGIVFDLRLPKDVSRKAAAKKKG